MQQMTGKQLRFQSDLPFQSSSTSNEVRNDETKLSKKPREISTGRVGDSTTTKNSMGRNGYRDYIHFQDSQKNRDQTSHSRFPNDVPTTTRKRSISRHELEEIDNKKPRKDSEVASKTRVG